MFKFFNSTSSVIVTDNSVTQLQPKLRLVLKKIDKLVESKDKESIPDKLKKQVDSLAKLFYSEPENLADERIDDELSQKNIEKMKNKFQGIRDLLNEQEEVVVQEMLTLTPQQQADVIAFWEIVSEFFCDLMDAMNEWFMEILKEIKKGKKLNRNSLKQTFNEINQIVKQLFTSFQHESAHFENHVSSESDKKEQGRGDSKRFNDQIPKKDIPVRSETAKKEQGPGNTEDPMMQFQEQKGLQ